MATFLLMHDISRVTAIILDMEAVVVLLVTMVELYKTRSRISASAG